MKSKQDFDLSYLSQHFAADVRGVCDLIMDEVHLFGGERRIVVDQVLLQGLFRGDASTTFRLFRNVLDMLLDRFGGARQHFEFLGVDDGDGAAFVGGVDVTLVLLQLVVVVVVVADVVAGVSDSNPDRLDVARGLLLGREVLQDRSERTKRTQR